MARSLTQDVLDRPSAQVFQQLCDFLIHTALAYRETMNRPGFLVHDAAAIAYAFYPSLFTFQRAAIDVETQGHHTRGQTIRDRRLTAQPFANAWVSCDVDCESFFTSLLSDLAQGFQQLTL
jgi:inosine-uridine nucleoside N-ribohydrolase